MKKITIGLLILWIPVSVVWINISQVRSALASTKIKNLQSENMTLQSLATTNQTLMASNQVLLSDTKKATEHLEEARRIILDLGAAYSSSTNNLMVAQDQSKDALFWFGSWAMLAHDVIHAESDAELRLVKGIHEKGTDLTATDNYINHLLRTGAVTKGSSGVLYWVNSNEEIVLKDKTNTLTSLAEKLAVAESKNVKLSGIEREFEDFKDHAIYWVERTLTLTYNLGKASTSDDLWAIQQECKSNNYKHLSESAELLIKRGALELDKNGFARSVTSTNTISAKEKTIIGDPFATPEKGP